MTNGTEYQHEFLRPDIERYAETEGVSFDRAWAVIHTPIADLTDEQIALMTHLFGWCLRDLELDDKVSISTERG